MRLMATTPAAAPLVAWIKDDELDISWMMDRVARIWGSGSSWAGYHVHIHFLPT